MILRARIGSQATTQGTHQLYVTGVGLQAHLVTCDPIFLVQNVETVNRVTSDQCTVSHEDVTLPGHLTPAVVCQFCSLFDSSVITAVFCKFQTF